MAGLVRLEGGPLSPEEVSEALRLHLSYSPADLFVPDWAAAVLIDRSVARVLRAIRNKSVKLFCVDVVRSDAVHMEPAAPIRDQRADVDTP